jgi:copper chaperone CopZ
MESALFDVPQMYADHHGLRVREVLLQSPGVQEVKASPMLRRVLVTFDPAANSAEGLQEILVEAGYGPDVCIECAPPPLRKEDGSFWHTLRPRMTETNPLDIEMSGDFRKY